MRRKLASFLFLIAATLIVSGDVHADGNWWWGGSPFVNRLYRSDREIPFYAEFPPVYYSHIVPRTYGQSPYAYWPGPFTPMMTPEPIMVPNPYFDVVPEEVPAPARKAEEAQDFKRQKCESRVPWTGSGAESLRGTATGDCI